MSDFQIAAGLTSQSINVYVKNASTGLGLTGLAYNTSGLAAYYSFAGPNAGSAQIALANLAAVNSAWSAGGFKEIDAANMPGLYRLDIPDAALAASKGLEVSLVVHGAENMVPITMTIELTAWNNQATVASQVLATAMTESYPTKGNTMTVAQALYDIVQHLGERSITGTTVVIKKRDGSTSAKTFTLDSASAPTSITEET